MNVNVMKDDSVRHGDVISNDNLRARIDMNYGVVLNARMVAENNRSEVRADGNTGRDQAFMADANIANQNSVRMNKRIGWDLWSFTLKFIQCHGNQPCC